MIASFCVAYSRRLIGQVDQGCPMARMSREHFRKFDHLHQQYPMALLQRIVEAKFV